MFKVLVIAYYFPPLGLSGVQRTLKFVKYMPPHGWQPTVITTGNIAYYAHDKSLQDELNKLDIDVIRTSSFDPNTILSKFGTVKMPGEKLRKVLNMFSQTFFIPDNKISWSKKAFDTASEILSKETYDVIFISAPPFSAFKISIKLKKKCIFFLKERSHEIHPSPLLVPLEEQLRILAAGAGVGGGLYRPDETINYLKNPNQTADLVSVVRTIYDSRFGEKESRDINLAILEFLKIKNFIE